MEYIDKKIGEINFDLLRKNSVRMRIILPLVALIVGFLTANPVF